MGEAGRTGWHEAPFRPRNLGDTLGAFGRFKEGRRAERATRILCPSFSGSEDWYLDLREPGGPRFSIARAALSRGHPAYRMGGGGYTTSGVLGVSMSIRLISGVPTPAVYGEHFERTPVGYPCQALEDELLQTVDIRLLPSRSMGQPGVYRTGTISFYVCGGGVGRPMSGWLQTFVNKPATARFRRYVLVSSKAWREPIRT